MIDEHNKISEKLRFQAQLLDSVREAVVATDLEGHVIYWGKGAELLYGYSASEVMGLPITFIVPSGEESQERERMRQVRETGLWTGQYRQQRRDGSTFWADTIISLVTDESGQPWGLIGIDRDITERKVAEQAVRQRNAELTVLNAVATAVNEALDLRVALVAALKEVVDFLGVDGAEVHLVEPGVVLTFAAHYGLEPAFVAATHDMQFPVGEEIPGLSVAKGVPIYVPEVKDEEPYRRRDLARDAGYHSLLCVPILGREILGAVTLYSRQRRSFTAELHTLLTTIGRQLAIAIERAELFEALRESEARYRLVSELTSDYAYAYRIEPDGSVVLEWMTEAFKRVTGFTASEVAGYQGWIELVHPDDVPIVEARTQTLISGQSDVSEFRIITKNGEVRWLRDHSLPIWHEGKGRIVRIYGGAQDITERKRATEESQRYAQQLEALRQVGLELTVELELDTLLRSIVSHAIKLLQASAGGIDLYRPEQELLEWVVSIGAELPEFNTMLRRGEGLSGRVWQRGEPVIVDDYPAWPGRVTSGESDSWTAVIGVPVQWGNQFLGVLVVMAEPPRTFSPADARLLEMFATQAAIAIQNARLVEQLRLDTADLEARVAERTRELAQANEQLKELDRLKSKFVSDVSHELRTPVTNLALYLDLLELGRSDKQAEYMDVLRHQSARLKQLTEDVLDLSRLQLDKERLVFGPVDLNAVVKDVMTTQCPRAETAGLTLDFEADDSLPPVEGERGRLAQVVTNLVVNAINYTREGHIRVRTYQDRQRKRACLVVEDTGMGIDSIDRLHLFERFYRGRRVSQLNIPGTGLGLAIAKEIVDLHGGQIEVQSEVGQGSTFTVWLPLEEQ